MSSIQRRVVFITGSAGNLGVAVARAFLNTNAHLVLVDRSPDRLEQIYADLAGKSDHLFVHSVDLIDPKLVERAVREAVDRFKRIDVLVNTVGGYRAGSALDATPLEDWDFLFNLNARSLFVTCRAVIPVMKRNGFGRILNVASRTALRGEPNASLYSASKSVALSLTESMAAELAATGITANCVLPGLIDTPQNRAAMPSADFSQWVKPDSVAQVIQFLASDSALDITGAAIPVYGGG